jgi:hypothetical protein
MLCRQVAAIALGRRGEKIVEVSVSYSKLRASLSHIYRCGLERTKSGVTQDTEMAQHLGAEQTSYHILGHLKFLSHFLE